MSSYVLSAKLQTAVAVANLHDRVKYQGYMFSSFVWGGCSAAGAVVSSISFCSSGLDAETLRGGLCGAADAWHGFHSPFQDRSPV